MFLDRNTKRYLKTFITKQVVILFCIGLVIGYANLKIKQKEYEDINSISGERKIIAVVLDCEAKEYNNVLVIKGKNSVFKNKKMLLYTNKNNKFEVGDLIVFNGELQ